MPCIDAFAPLCPLVAQPPEAPILRRRRSSLCARAIRRDHPRQPFKSAAFYLGWEVAPREVAVVREGKVHRGGSVQEAIARSRIGVAREVVQVTGTVSR
jgi:hypothetical protein